MIKRNCLTDKFCLYTKLVKITLVLIALLNDSIHQKVYYSFEFKSINELFHSYLCIDMHTFIHYLHICICDMHTYLWQWM